MINSKNIKEQSIHLHLKNGVTPGIQTVEYETEKC